VSEFIATHLIISMRRGVTSNSNSPMWRCVCRDGERVNIFKHTDPKKNTYTLFHEWWPEMDGLVMDQVIEFKEHPIGVIMRRTSDGKFWDPVEVGPRDGDPDPVFTPDADMFKEKSKNWARNVSAVQLLDWVIVWDTETTGVGTDDEIVSIAACNPLGDRLLDLRIRPEHPERLLEGDPSPASITGITPESLAKCPTFPQVYSQIKQVLDGQIWVIYNSGFDTKMLDQVCIRHGLTPITPLGVNDAMEMFAEWNGEWNPVYRKFVPKTLTVAAETMGIIADNAHDALADVLTTVALVRALAE